MRTRRMRSIAPWRKTTLSHSINCRLGKLKRGNLLTCHAVLGKKNSVGGAKSSMTSSSVRVLDPWVCACVRFTEQLRAPQARRIMDHVRFVLLDVQVVPRLFVQVMPVLQMLQSLERRGRVSTRTCVQLESVGSFQNFIHRFLQDITRHIASGLIPQCRLSSKRSASRPSSCGLWTRKSLIRRNLFHITQKVGVRVPRGIKQI